MSKMDSNQNRYSLRTKILSYTLILVYIAYLSTRTEYIFSLAISEIILTYGLPVLISLLLLIMVAFNIKLGGDSP